VARRRVHARGMAEGASHGTAGPDVQDCQWLQKLMSLGFLRAAWRPHGDVCVVRAVARQREVLVAEQASWVQRMQKALVPMNIQLTEVLTDVMGMTGQV
jgi:transposase